MGQLRDLSKGVIYREPNNQKGLKALREFQQQEAVTNLEMREQWDEWEMDHRVWESWSHGGGATR